MNIMPYLPILLALLVGLVVFFFRRQQGKTFSRSHQTALGLGVVWIAMGVIFKNTSIGSLGAIMMVLGLGLLLRDRFAGADS